MEHTTTELDDILGGRLPRRCLVYKGMNLPLTFSLVKQCPRRTDHPWELDLRTGELRPQRCKANWCPYCVQVKTRQIARAVGASDPTAMLTFTQVGTTWKVVQRRMNKLSEYLRADGYRFDWVWKVECNSSGHAEHDHHVHAYVHGEAVPEELAFDAAAQRVGFGAMTHFLVLTGSTFHSARYLWGKKPHELHPLRLAHHLEMNGGRLHHPSRNFWPVSYTHLTLPTKRIV